MTERVYVVSLDTKVDLVISGVSFSIHVVILVHPTCEASRALLTPQ